MIQIPASVLPSKGFTAGSLLKQFPGAKLADVREALDKLVAKGTLTVKVAKSGARNYSPVKDAKGRTRLRSVPNLPVTASNDRAERIVMAKAEAKALKAWEATPKAKQGPRPATPNLDAVNAGTKTTKARQASGDGSPRGTTVRFLHDGKALPNSQNKLSSVAWYFTKGIGGDDVDRLSVKDLRALLAAEGVADPSNTVGWSVTLPNGVVLSTEAL